MKKLSEANIKKLIDTIIIRVDSREKLPNHITKCFDKYGVNWEVQKLLSGDYTAVLPANEKLGTEEINLENIVCIERKMSCDEIIQNLTTNKDRFYREFERTEAKIPILIEDSFENASNGAYRSKVTPKQFLGALFSFTDSNDTYFFFLEDKEFSALWIYDIFKYKIRNMLKINKTLDL